VHWGAPLDACQKLVANPTAVTAKLDDVAAVLDRRAHGPATSPAPSAVVSFSCYFEGGTPERSSNAFTLAGSTFTAEELHVPPTATGNTLFIDRYDAVAKLLVRGFHYGALLSEAGIEQGPATGLQAAFAGQDFLLSRVHGLDSLDIYLDAGFVAERPDLLEVYPYQRHLKNYVQIFRRQYRRERSRL
jgi:hypothetical protein